MSIRWLVWGLNAAIALAALLFVAALVIAVGAPLLGEPLLTSWSVASVAGDPSPLPASAPARLQLDQGTLELSGGDSWLLALKAVDVMVLGALALGTLTLLRRFAVDTHRGHPFGDHAARRLRRIAGLLVCWPLWQALSAGLAQAWLLANAWHVAPDMLLLNSLAAAPSQPGAIRVLVEADIGAAIAGLVLLVVAQAFAHGIDQRRHLDEIV